MIVLMNTCPKAIHAMSKIRSATILTLLLTNSMNCFSKNNTHFQPDYIIVGAGAGGSVLAARLAENKNIKVLLIEAGPDNTNDPHIKNAADFHDLWFSDTLKPEGSTSNWSFLTTPQQGKRYSYPRGTGLGGSTNHTGLIDGRGSDVIYDHWAKILGDNSWSAKSVRHYFIRMEQFDDLSAQQGIHGKHGWQYVRKNIIKEPFDFDLIAAAKEELGIPFRKDFYDNPNDISGIGANSISVYKDGTRSYAAKDLLLPRYKENKQKGWNNFEIYTNQLVSKIIFKDKRAIGVEVIKSPRAYFVDNRHKNNKHAIKVKYFAKKEIILAGGSINTPQLLLLSGIGPKADLSKQGIPVILDLPGVGHHLKDHMEMSHVYKVLNLPNKVWLTQANELAKKNPYWAKYGDKELSNAVGATMILDWFSDLDTRNKKNPDIHVSISHYMFRDFNYDPKIFKGTSPSTIAMANYSSVYEKQSSKKPISYLFFLTEIVKVKADSGSIKLANKNPIMPPIIDLQYYKSEEDLTRLAKAIMMERQLMNSPKMRKYKAIEVFPGAQYKTLAEIKTYIKKYSAFGHHMTGTAKMGNNNDLMAVADSNGKVRGVKGLRICDASLAPTQPGYNTSKPTYMIAEVIADKIKSGH